MAVLYEPLLFMATGNKSNLFVVAHFGCDVGVGLLTAGATLNYNSHQHYIVIGTTKLTWEIRPAVGTGAL
jgi:hypothetical protein